MTKTVKRIIFALFLSSILAFNGLAQAGSYWQEKPKEKPKEKPQETPKKGNEDRGGGKQGEEKKKEKKPDGDSF